MIFTTTSDLPADLQVYLDRELLENMYPETIHDRFGQTRPVPMNSGQRIQFEQSTPLAVATTPLTEGQPPTGKKYTQSRIFATLAQYGDFIPYTDWVDMTSLSPVLVRLAGVLGPQGGQTFDILVRNTLITGTSVRYSNGVAARTDIVTAIQRTDIEKAILSIMQANGKPIREMVKAGPNIGTVPLQPCFPAITHVDCIYDYRQLEGFISVEEYASQGDRMLGEFGAVGQVRLCATTNSKIWADGGGAVGVTGLISTSAAQVDVYTTLVFSKEAYGIIPLQKRNIQNVVKKIGSAGASDPLNQYGTSGWKMATTSRILQDALMCRIEHGATSL